MWPLWASLTGKGRKVRQVDVSDLAWEYIFPAFMTALYTSDHILVPLSNRAARRVINRKGAKIGLQIASHDLRSTFASEGWEASHDMIALQRQLGHAKADTTIGYVGLTPERMRAVVEFGRKSKDKDTKD
jgi:integrase/recombinase XerC